MLESTRREWGALGLILLLALGLRLVNLGGRTLWYDEAFAVLFAEKGWDAMIDGTLTPVEGGAADVHPLLYYVALNGWMEVFGQGAFVVRLFSVLLGVATVGAVFGLGRDWFQDDRTALAAALLTAVAPFHVQYSQEARMYALLALFLTLATWLYWRAWERGGAGYWLGFGIVAGISMYTQQLAAFFLLALGLLPVVYRRRREMIGTALAAGLALVIYLPWMLYLPDQLGKLRQYWVQKPNVLHFWLALRSFVSVNLDFSPAWWLPTFLLAAILSVFLLYRTAQVLRARTPDPDRAPLGWAVWLAFMPIVLMWAGSYVFQPVFLPRALLPSAVMFYCALAWLFVRGGIPKPITRLLIAGWVVVMAFGLITHYTWDTFPNPPFDKAANYLVAHVEPGDVVVHGNKITALPMVYYARNLPQRYVHDIPGSGSDTLAAPTQEALGLIADPSVAEAVKDADRVWYVAFERLEEEMAELVEDDPENAQYDSLSWLRDHFVEDQALAFGDLQIVLFVRSD